MAHLTTAGDADAEAPIGLVGAPLAADRLRRDGATFDPARLRATLSGMGSGGTMFETAAELSSLVADQWRRFGGGNDDRTSKPPSAGVRCELARHELTCSWGGNNAVTRPAVHALGLPLERVGLITLDAHFDLRDTSEGLGNGNPVRALREDGLHGRNIAQVGIAPFANSAAMHRDAIEGGHLVVTIGEVGAGGIERAVARR